MQCYLCPEEATRSCTQCGRPTCPSHCDFRHFKYDGSRLVCNDCAEDKDRDNARQWTITVIIILVIIFIAIMKA